MPLPYDCDVTLPTATRYASPKFRRFARSFDPYRLDYEDAVELVAFLQMVPIHASAYIFGWDRDGVGGARSLIQSQELFEAGQVLDEANRRLVTPPDALMVLSAMQDGGWRRGPVPAIVTDGVRALRKGGQSLPKIAVQLGVTYEQAKVIAKVRRPRIAALGPVFAA